MMLSLSDKQIETRSMPLLQPLQLSKQGLKEYEVI